MTVQSKACVSLFLVLFAANCAYRAKSLEKDVTYNSGLPRGSWAAGQVYELLRVGYLMNDGDRIMLKDPQEVTSGTEREIHPALREDFVGVAEPGWRYRVVSLRRNDLSAAPFVRVIGAFEGDRMKGREVRVDRFSDREWPIEFGDEFGIVLNPNPKDVKRIE